MSSTVVENITAAIAEAEEIEPASLDVSIQRHVSTDAIHDLVNHRSDSWRLQFETPHHVVEIAGNRTILVDGNPAQTSL